MKPFQAKGDWWIPENRRKRSASGALVYSPRDGGRLDAFGKRLDGGSVYEPVIHGDTESGLVTLLDCIVERTTSRDLSDNFAQVITCERVVLGQHISRNTLFGSAIVRIKYLDDWARMGSIEGLGDARQHIPGAGDGFYYRREPSLEARIPDGSSVTLGVRTRGHLEANETSLWVEHEMLVNLATTKSLDRLVDGYVTPLVDLLTLLVDRPSGVVSLRVARRPRETGGYVTRFDYCDIGLVTGETESWKQERASPGVSIVPRDDFDFAVRLPRWFELVGRLQGILGLAFGLRYAGEMSFPNRFLNASMAAEGLHRATIPSTRAKIRFKNQATRAWLSQYPEHERDVIKTRLNQYINEPSLADRLSGLVEKAGEAFRELVPNPEPWIKLVKNIRNDLTHQEGVPRIQIGSVQVSILADSTAMLVYICLLVDLGYESGDLKDRVFRSFRVRALQAELHAVLAGV